MVIRKRYVDGPFGQVHLRENTPLGGPPLVCLHATAYSSRSFVALAEALDGRRHVIAIDTPGYGQSDPPPGRIDIAGYADAIAAALSPEAPAMTLLGHHTGVAIAAEMALRHPRNVSRLVLSGIPYFQALDFAGWKARLTVRHSLDENLDHLAERWDFLVGSRPAGLTLKRAFGNFVDELLAWPNGSWAHEALFAWPVAERLAAVAQPTLVLNLPGHLAGPSRIAAAMICDATVEELPDVGGAPFDLHADVLAAKIDAFLRAGALTPSVA